MSVPASASPVALSWLSHSTRVVKRVARWALGLILLFWGLILLAWLLLHEVILPHIDEWRPLLERQASRSLGVQLRIGSIEVSSGGWSSAIEMRDVRLLDAAGREALRLPRVAASLSMRSLMSMQLRFDQLLIDAPQLEVRRDAAGKIFVAGLSVDAAQQTGSADLAEEWADWLLSQHEFAILKGRVRWVDEQRAAPPLELSDVSLVLRNGLRKYELRLDATPPPAWGERFSLRARFTQSLLKRPSEVQFWSGQLYADLPRSDLRELRRHITLPFELSEGDGALRAWFDFKNGQPYSATVDVGLRSVQLRLTPQAQLLALERIEGRLQLQYEAQRFSLQATQLGFISGDGVVWPRSDWGVVLRLAAPSKALPGAGLGKSADNGADNGIDSTAGLAPLLGGELTAQRLDLALMAQLAQRLPVGAVPRAWLAELAPQGVVSGLSAKWDGALDAPRSYRVKAVVEGLQIAAKPAAAVPLPVPVPAAASAASSGRAGLGRPGVSGVQLQLDANERGGQAQLLMKDGELLLPGLFEQALPPVKSLAAKLNWRIDPVAKQAPQLELRVSGLQLVNPDFQGNFDAVWRSGAGQASRYPGHLELSGRIDKADAKKVVNYLPLSLGEPTRSWVRDAVRSGEARAVSVRLRGDLAEFPFADAAGAKPGGEPTGVFRITAQARDVELAYVPPLAGQPPTWPALQQANAELVFDRASLQIRNGRAKVLGFELGNVNGGVKDLLHSSLLEIDGSGSGPTAELLRFMRASPVNEWTGAALANATASGPATLKLALHLPLNDLNKSNVKGSVQLLGSDLRLRPDVPLLGNARGRVEFDRDGVKVIGGQARVLGSDASFDGGTQPGGALRFTAQGVASAEAMRRLPDLGSAVGVAARLAQSATGQAAYRLQLGFLRGQTEFSLTSNLVGIGLDLPAPLRKDPETALPLRLQTVLQGNRDELRFELGNTLQAHYLRDISVEPARVLQGALSIQDNLPPLPASGVQLLANLDRVNLDAWNSTVERLLSPVAGNGAAAAAAAVNGNGNVNNNGIAALESAYLPTQMALRAQSLQVAGRNLTRVVAGVTRAPAPERNAWRITLDAEQLSGYLELRPPSATQAGRVFARLGRLSLPKQEADSVSQLLDSQPGTVPALDLVIDDFELRGKKLGRLEVEAQAVGTAREWRLNKLQLKAPDAVLNATGQWALAAGTVGRQTHLKWTLDVLDAGNMLERFGQGRVLRGGKGQLTGQIGWQGSPLSPDYASMAGQLHVALESGQFLQAEPGVGRLLGVLSLQSLPRRFLLDFRDVFSEGFAFDGISGDVMIERGVASSSNLRTRGVQAVVLLEGHADLAAETQNLRVLVVPELNVGGASLAYAAINPAIGLGTFLAQLLLSRPMAAANTREFHVTGTWVDPKVERVDRRFGEAEKTDKTDKSEKSDKSDKAASAP